MNANAGLILQIFIAGITAGSICNRDKKVPLHSFYLSECSGTFAGAQRKNTKKP